jgi:hypothetical protein
LRDHSEDKHRLAQPARWFRVLPVSETLLVLTNRICWCSNRRYSSICPVSSSNWREMSVSHHRPLRVRRVRARNTPRVIGAADALRTQGDTGCEMEWYGMLEFRAGGRWMETSASACVASGTGIQGRDTPTGIPKTGSPRSEVTSQDSSHPQNSCDAPWPEWSALAPLKQGRGVLGGRVLRRLGRGV